MHRVSAALGCVLPAHILRCVRALAVGNMYPPHHLGGYELVWRAAVRHLRELGNEVRVLTTDFRVPYPGEPDDNDVRRELRWWWRDHAFPRLPPRERLAVERHNGRVLERHLAELRPDVVTWWSMGGMSMSLIERVRRRGLPAVAFVQDDWLDYGLRVDAWLALFAGPRRGRLAGTAEALLRMPARVDLDRAARYVFVSEATRERALAAGRKLLDTGVAHSGIDPSYLDPLPARDWEWRLLYVGRIDARKGIVTAVDALAHLPEEATLTVVGGGDPGAASELRAQAARLGVADRVQLAGFMPRSAVRAAYGDADVVVFPVIWEEPWGLVPIEAMALGRPVVATGRGGSGEYLRHGENALLFEAGNAEALAAAVTRLAGDPALRARLREGGLATAPGYTEDVFNGIVAAELARACG
jgi:glycogen(starch) synthase